MMQGGNAMVFCLDLSIVETSPRSNRVSGTVEISLSKMRTGMGMWLRYSKELIGYMSFGSLSKYDCIGVMVPCCSVGISASKPIGLLNVE
eukprot:4771105-Ditylum_brightwellii.AAC.1